MQKIMPQSKSQGNFSFFSKKVNVLYVKNNSFELSTVVMSKKPKIIHRLKSESISALIEKSKIKSAYLLLGNEFAYVVNFTIPAHIQGSEERQYIYRKISEIIPEQLEDKDWDYKETVQGKEEKNVLAFAFVKDRFKELNEILQSLPLEIIAIEPEEISITRNENPIIGISLKNDISGKDSNSLNIKISKKRAVFNIVLMFSWSVVSISSLTMLLLLDMIFRGWLY